MMLAKMTKDWKLKNKDRKEDRNQEQKTKLSRNQDDTRNRSSDAAETQRTQQGNTGLKIPRLI